MYVHINVFIPMFDFTIASVPDRVGITNAGEEASLGMQQTLPFNWSTSYYFISPYSLISLHCPNTADKWRVVLKAKRLDYINASFVNVGIKHVYNEIIPSCSIMILCYLLASYPGSLGRGKKSLVSTVCACA